MCVHFGSWDGHKEWSMTLPEGEDAVAVTAGDAFVGVATSRRLLRLFAVSGLQRALVSIPGPVVALAIHGTKMIVTFHMGMGNERK